MGRVCRGSIYLLILSRSIADHHLRVELSSYPWAEMAGEIYTVVRSIVTGNRRLQKIIFSPGKNMFSTKSATGFRKFMLQ